MLKRIDNDFCVCLYKTRLTSESRQVVCQDQKEKDLKKKRYIIDLKNKKNRKKLLAYYTLYEKIEKTL